MNQDALFSRPQSSYWVTTRLIREVGQSYIATSSPEDIHKAINDYMDIENCDKEHFIVACLNIKNDINAFNIVSVGNLNNTIVTPREVFRPAILANSASIILIHNHPSGNPTPSKQDIEITKSLQKAGEVLGIEVLDHIIIGYKKYISFKERGLL